MPTPKKIAFCTPSLYIPGGVERVLTTKANWLAEHGYDITIILTDGNGREPYYPLSPKIHVVQLDINFEVMWEMPFWKKALVYLQKQRRFKKALKETLFRLRPDITVSLLRREINFITSIKDGSRKFGEMHINRDHFRNFEPGNTNFVKEAFSRYWMNSLIGKLKRLDRLFVLSEEDKKKWTELDNVQAIPNPIPFTGQDISTLENKKAIAVGRYVHEKGFDMLLEAWAIVHKQYPDWQLNIYGMGDRTAFQQQADRLQLGDSCQLNGASSCIQQQYADSSLYVLSSRFEGFGMVIVEAMACGLPVVSFDCPCGPRNIIEHGRNGLLSENSNPEALARDICSLIGDKERMTAMAAYAKQSSKKYELDNIMKAWTKAYDE